MYIINTFYIKTRRFLVFINRFSNGWKIVKFSILAYFKRLKCECRRRYFPPQNENFKVASYTVTDGTAVTEVRIYGPVSRGPIAPLRFWNINDRIIMILYIFQYTTNAIMDWRKLLIEISAVNSCSGREMRNIFKQRSSSDQETAVV